MPLKRNGLMRMKEFKITQLRFDGNHIRAQTSLFHRFSIGFIAEILNGLL